ncbi:DUF58 domain-containing protein [Sporosarcina thermotolerans]|uniref:DUF58 domain-containing protein n=1 Tax=Sporosarcina thermotolerans TaxID=633404 RepID=A0AAW9A996_9BACL|nr:DUF58 domain-containing protein [Sporosarcina thermotolerans]MDW0117629.1 DUF58 domain-containing protein [Sporosarcina thermotolerans]
MNKGRKLLSMTGRFAFIVSLFFSVYVFAMFQGGKVSWTIFYMLTPFLLYSIILFVYPINTIKAERITRSHVVKSGGKLTVTVKLHRSFPFPLLYTVASEQWVDSELAANANNRTKHIFIFGFKKEVEWSYEIERMPRGEHIVEGIEIEVTDFFGWIQKRGFIDLKDTILVFPNTTPMHYAPINAQYDRGSLASPFSLIKDTTMATGVRDYQAGDRVTWIHWKSFARTQNLMTKEFEDRQSEDLIIMLDNRESETFEEQVELTASIVEEASGTQSNIAFVSAGAETSVFPFINSADQLHDVFVHLAKVRPIPAEDVNPLESFTFTAVAGSVVLVTGSPDWPFVQSVMGFVKNRKSVICFVVVNKTVPVSERLQEQIRYAESKGITIHVLGKMQFSDAFKEVANL